jgi:hypothetical protein
VNQVSGVLLLAFGVAALMAATGKI